MVQPLDRASTMIRYMPFGTALTSARSIASSWAARSSATSRRRPWTSPSIVLSRATRAEGYRRRNDRPIVGVEKYAPEPVSRRHSDFNGAQSAQLRYFLKDYAGTLYTSACSIAACPRTRCTPACRKVRVGSSRGSSGSARVATDSMADCRRLRQATAQVAIPRLRAAAVPA
jgi:hypothetical protein